MAEWSTRQVAEAVGISTTRAINYATRWGLGIIAHGPGSRAAWTSRDVATFQTLLRVQKALGEVRGHVARQIIVQMAACKWGTPTLTVKLTDKVTVEVAPVWDVGAEALAAA